MKPVPLPKTIQEMVTPFAIFEAADALHDKPSG
jgi:hypothetical protein